MDRQDIQTRRAENQVWNGSGAYDTKPELLVFDGGGDADLYGNTVLGLAGRYYRFDLFRPLLNDFHRSVQEGLYTDVFFLVLENAVFRRGAQERPILPALRAAYARTLLRDTPPAEGMTDGALRRAWAQQVLGQPCDKALVPVLADMERALCTGVHKNCRLHVTDGTPPQRPPSPEAAWDAEQFRRQREKNRAYYQSQLSQNRLTIARLTQKLHNTLLLKQEDDGGLCRAGALCPALAWRAAALDDERVFTRRQPGDPGELTVDILLDGSASQNQQQEKLAAQAYIIVESLTRCHIPVRVTAFCSVSGCTVLRILRDYDHPEQNDRVMDYVSAGWNRDGLALRAMGRLMRQTAGEKRLLLVLSDASPNDDQRIPGGLGGHAYTGKRGVDDTAAEAAALRLHGVTPVCLFSGSDREAPDARRIYGAAMERLPSVGWLADTVTRLIKGQIRKG